MTGLTDAFVACLYEDTFVRTSVIHDSLSTRWVPWSHRAFMFQITHPSSILYLGVFDYDEGPLESHDPIGRVVIHLDNFEHAWPIFQRYDCPFTIFIATDITDGSSELWWLILERAIADSQKISTEVAGETISGETRTAAQKTQAYEKLYKLVRWGLEEAEQRKWIRQFADAQGIDVNAHCRAEAMTWDQVREINENPLCTIGAHTVHHYSVGRLSEEDAYLEMILSRGRIAEELGSAPQYFCYPYGDEISAGPREFALAERAGFEAAVTTRKGMVYPGHGEHLTALPRVSLNGAFQHVRYVDVMMSGLPFMLANRFRAVNAA